ncbi:MAG: hypothetical protein SOU16_11430 [Faecalimonas sp.]|nr:hypothetical protein [Faecalimonas sp.]
MKKLQEKHLLDYLTFSMGMEFISQLKYLDQIEKIKLVHLLKKIPVEQFSLKEWNDVACYICNLPTMETSENAKKEIFTALTVSDDNSGHIEED